MPCYSCCKMCSKFSLYFACLPVFGFSSTTRTGLGCPTRSRALALTALVAENLAGFFFLDIAKQVSDSGRPAGYCAWPSAQISETELLMHYECRNEFACEG